ncbi:YlbF family regulator [Desulfallas sp. Bu1-1]|uniref:YlbF family regulator n=1 Tax=Desulfallas sp. Bu1-1 TaxID=2787620 RepID=UPI00189FEDDC|nr:YlbF family regulator [Desulfallas sp. Bu1-1]MBF7083360.1 YlbF family regulator [Desulfallas sp. Bu1-1]
MSILEKAYELGQEIAASRELADMKNAELLMLQNEEAKKIIEEFKEKQKIYMSIQRQGKELTSSQKEDVERIEKAMLDNPLIYNFFKAQQNFEKVLEEINNIISQAIAGQHASCSDECCSSCSGCGD